MAFQIQLFLYAKAVRLLKLRQLPQHLGLQQIKQQMVLFLMLNILVLHFSVHKDKSCQH
jgi:hypothetical protein